MTSMNFLSRNPCDIPILRLELRIDLTDSELNLPLGHSIQLEPRMLFKRTALLSQSWV